MGLSYTSPRIVLEAGNLEIIDRDQLLEVMVQEGEVCEGGLRQPTMHVAHADGSPLSRRAAPDSHAICRHPAGSNEVSIFQFSSIVDMLRES
jgi:hypothetical protein